MTKRKRNRDLSPGQKTPPQAQAGCCGQQVISNGAGNTRTSNLHTTTQNTAGLPLTQTTTSGSQLIQHSLQASQEFWLECVKDWYPDRHTKTYFLPPLFFRKIQYDIATVEDLPVLVPEPATKRPKPDPTPCYPSQGLSGRPVAGQVFTVPQGPPAPLPRYIETDALDDAAAERFLGCLRALSQQQQDPMMVISQLEFRKYLDNDTDPITAAKNAAGCDSLPRSSTVSHQQYQDGEFDVLVIHRQYGLLVCEVKAVGANRSDIADLNQAVADKVQKAIKQLNKETEVLKHLTSDIATVQVTKTLILPHVTSAELRQALSTNALLLQDVCACLDTTDLSVAVSRCLCAEHMPTTSDLLRFTNQTASPCQPTSPNDQPNEETIQSPVDGINQSKSQTQTNQPTTENQTTQQTFLNFTNHASFSSQPTCKIDTKVSTGRSSQMSNNQINQLGNTAISPPTQHSPGSDLSPLTQWWQNVTSQGHGCDPHMCEAVYDQLLARFCGPATTVEVPTVTAPRRAVPKKRKHTPARKVVRTAGAAVAETGLVHSLLALYPDQVSLLSDNTLNCVHLRGPPGVGKTLLLVLKAVQWLHQGHDVHILCYKRENTAVSILIERQLQCMLAHNPVPNSGKVHLIRCDGTLPYNDDVNLLLSKASDGKLCIIADEVSPKNDVYAEWFDLLIDRLRKDVGWLCLWCASVHGLILPHPWLTEKVLTTPLRSPPTVTREVAKSTDMKSSNIPAYSATLVPMATEGPPVRWLAHQGGKDGHKGGALNCEACGDRLLEHLDDLTVGKGTDPDSLQYRDVVLLAPSRLIQAKATYSVKCERGIIGKLRARGLPVQLLSTHSTETDIGEVALASKDCITVTDYSHVSGLERRVVIGMGTSNEQVDLRNRLLAMSRCTGQLIWIGSVSRQ